MKKIVVAAIFLTIVSILSDVHCRQPDHRQIPNQSSKSDLRLPSFDTKKLKPEYREVVQKLQTFARTSAVRAQQISKLPKDRKARVAGKFEKKFKKDLRKMQLMTNRLQHAPRNALLSHQAAESSVFGKLQEFITTINELPVKVHCLIYDCTHIFSTAPPQPGVVATTSTPPESSESDNESDYHSWEYEDYF